MRQRKRSNKITFVKLKAEKLADDIIKVQEKEICEMKAMIKSLENQ
ncbi:MAG: hypothetical protein ACI9V1_001652 [Spirosomataceae bacterium]